MERILTGIDPIHPETVAGATPPRPSLLSAPHGGGASGTVQQSIRLLSALRPGENAPRSTRSGRTKGWVVFVSVALAGAAALVLATYSDNPGNPDVALMGAKPALQPTAPRAEQAAASTVESPSGSSAATAKGIERLVVDEPDSPARVETGSEGLVRLPGMAVASEATAAPPSAASATAPAARLVKSRPVTPKHSVTAGIRGRTDSRPDTPARDPDAELVAAIMARMESFTGVSSPSAGDRSGTIASLVRDCSSIEDSESALACRRRICAGYWGKAQACPRSMAPAAASR